MTSTVHTQPATARKTLRTFISGMPRLLVGESPHRRLARQLPLEQFMAAAAAESSRRWIDGAAGSARAGIGWPVERLERPIPAEQGADGSADESKHHRDQPHAKNNGR